ncbi:unnamed protein product [Onchocerca ochengi]|uniref:Olfactomedin-like domain-containing protein n=1 Tax=Onchocerca ochengi TaxID=42157 RepID=A0A182DZZ2_ONCOC|nr:unnamed protein product [Onchocerca ochengi]
MLIQLLQLISIICYVAEAHLPFPIPSKPEPEERCNAKDCRNDKKSATIVALQNYQCPKKIDSATELSGKLYIFSDDKVWIFKNRKPKMITRIDKGNVFAMYDLKHNTVSLINDLETYYPNLPENFRTGIPFPSGQFKTYHLLDAHNLYEYDMKTKKIIFAQPLKTYLLC